MVKLFTIVIALATITSCNSMSEETTTQIVIGNERLNVYLPLLEGKRVGVVANHSTIIQNTHLVDSLITLGIDVQKIFSPEHGFRGDGDAGEYIETQIDKRTGLPVISLYGSRKKPTHEEFSNLDIILFDMQDVGVRIYTYISTMHYVMETCAEMNLPLIVLDRPNPNGFFVDGPVLDTNFRSFVGMHPVPLLHGMTIGEYAQMINGEGWLNGSLQCNLTVVSCLNYSHDSTYVLPIQPSPNLPNQTSIYLYPSLGFFEGTVVSVGRGTDFPFQVFGHPKFTTMEFYFTPESRPGASRYPPFKGEKCYGVDLRDFSHEYFLEQSKVNLTWLIYAYQSYPEKNKFFNNFFNLLAGNNTLRKLIEQGVSEEEIRNGWQNDINEFMRMREKYLLYPDFN